MAVFPSGRLFGGKDLCPDFDVSLTSRAQPEKFDTTLPGNGGLNPTNAQFLAYLATLPSWSHAAVTNATEFNAAAAAIDASGPAAGVIKFAATYNGDNLVPPNRPLPSGVQPDYTTCTIYCIPETLLSSGSFPEPAAIGAPFAVRTIKDSLPVIRSQNTGVSGWHAVDHFTGGMAQYGYRWIGFRFSPRSDGGSTIYARVCGNYQARGITTDRCHFDGVTEETVGGTALDQPTGFIMDGRYNASLECWYHEYASGSLEKQCVMVLNGGPTKVVGNVLLGNGECFIAGGQDPIAPSTITNYPRDLEFRRNFCRQNFGATPLHPAFYRLVSDGGNARTKQTGLTGAAYDAGTRTLTLSAGAFDTSRVSRASAGDSLGLRRYLWYVTAGAGAGSHGECSTYNSTTSVTSADTTLTLITGTPIDATSVIEIRESIKWISKNCFELKSMRRAYIEGCILENSWDMDGSQHFIAPFKSVNQGGAGTQSLTAEITWVNSLILNCWGGIQTTAMPTPPCLAAGKMHFENLLTVATPHLDFVAGDMTFNMPFVLGTDTTTLRRVTAVNFQQAIIGVWESANVGDAGAGSEHKLQALVLDGFLSSDAPHYRLEGIDMGGFQGGIAGYKANVDVTSASWRAGVTNAATVNQATDYPNTTDPGAGFVTYYSDDPAPFVNPLYDFTDPACDYSLKPGDPLAAQPNMGVDWPTLQAAVANVRPSKSVVPYQWLGTETTGGAGTADHLALTTQPSASTPSGQAHAQQPAGVIQDSANATVTGDTSAVTATLVLESGSGTARGTLTVTCIAGAFGFTDLGVDAAGGCTAHWDISRPGLPTRSTASFTITPSAGPLTYAPIVL